MNFFDSQRLLLHLLRLATRHDLNLSYISDTRTHTHTHTSSQRAVKDSVDRTADSNPHLVLSIEEI